MFFLLLLLSPTTFKRLLRCKQSTSPSTETNKKHLIDNMSEFASGNEELTLPKGEFGVYLLVLSSSDVILTSY